MAITIFPPGTPFPPGHPFAGGSQIVAGERVRPPAEWLTRVPVLERAPDRPPADAAPDETPPAE